MKTASELANQCCQARSSETSAYSYEEALNLSHALHPDWRVSDDGHTIRRELKFENFIAAVDFLNQVKDLAEQEAHHPDIELGYGYCHITFSTHDVNGLSENDFICAAKVDRLISDQ